MQNHNIFVLLLSFSTISTVVDLAEAGQILVQPRLEQDWYAVGYSRPVSSPTNSLKKTNNADVGTGEGEGTFVCKGIVPRAMLTIIDDDGDLKYYTDIYPVALEKKVSISTAVPASFIGKKNHLTWEMLEECQNNGMEVLCHTYAHPLSTKIGSMTEEDFRLDYSKAIEMFRTHCVDVDLLVFSGSTGLYNKAQVPARELFQGAFLAGDNQVNQIGTDPYKIKRYRIGSNYKWDVPVLKELVDSLKETGGWMVWMMHTSDKSNYNSKVPMVLGEIIDYCKKQNIPIVTGKKGFDVLTNAACMTEICSWQVWRLKAGWNLVALNLIPDSASIEKLEEIPAMMLDATNHDYVQVRDF